jgi:hypothetical protein
MAAQSSTPKKETRRHRRYELLASVEVRSGKETLALPARNISLGGVYVGADGNNLKRIAVGDQVEVTLFDLNDDARPTVRATAQVVRNDGKGLALTWASTDPVVARKLAELLGRLHPSTP